MMSHIWDSINRRYKYTVKSSNVRLQDDSDEEEEEKEGNEEENEEEKDNKDEEMEDEPKISHGQGAEILEHLENMKIQ